MPLTIIIDLDPNIVRLGPLLITWHGVFAVLGIIAAARLGFWLLEKDVPHLEGTGDGLSWMVVAGLIGALLPFHQRLKARLPNGVLGLLYFAVYAAGRFLLSYLRTDPGIFLGLRQAQIASLLMVLIALIAAPVLFRRAGAGAAPTPATPSRV